MTLFLSIGTTDSRRDAFGLGPPKVGPAKRRVTDSRREASHPSRLMLRKPCRKNLEGVENVGEVEIWIDEAPDGFVRIGDAVIESRAVEGLNREMMVEVTLKDGQRVKMHLKPTGPPNPRACPQTPRIAPRTDDLPLNGP